MNDAEPRSLVPPRPNLGPEPWQGPPPWTRALPALLVLALLMVAAAFRRRRRRAGPRAGRDRPPPGDAADFQPSHRDRLVALSASVRDALTVPLGTACRAKTTEELAADGRLEQLLGGQGLRELIEFLDQTDRLKFAPERTSHELGSLETMLAAWQPRVETLQSRLRAKPARRS